MSDEINIASASATDLGQRSYNEDANFRDDDYGLYIVADGVGGRAAGDVASQLACKVIAERSRTGASLTESINAAHKAIHAQAEDPDTPGRLGMACTVVVLRFDSAGIELAWSGDSRAYFWDGKLLRCLTRDHSLVEEQIESGELERADAFDHPQKNVILGALGGEDETLEIGSRSGPLPGPGCFLLCSDGLSDALPPGTICELLVSGGDLQRRCQALTDAARDSGKRDNITTLLVEVDGIAVTEQTVPVYEVFDPSTGESSWPQDRPAPSTPTVRRVRSRDTAEVETVATARFDQGGAPPRPQSLQRGVPNRRALGFGLTAVALALLVAFIAATL